MSKLRMIGEDVLADAFEPVLGLPCWWVKPGLGSCLTMEFGTPQLMVLEPGEPSANASEGAKRLSIRRKVYPRGDWHLWIWCCKWQITERSSIVGDSELEESVEEATRVLNGQRLVGVRRGEQIGTWHFSFDLDSTLSTQPFDSTAGDEEADDEDLEQWLLYEPNGLVLTALASGKLVREPGDKPSDGAT